jgi:alkylation response protein AidB-like acyl-CoA dehydrogenase
LLGLRFPLEYGGRGLSWTAESVAVEEVGVLGYGLGCAYSMVNIVGEAIYRFGSEWQKEKFLKPVIRSEKIAAEGSRSRGVVATSSARRQGLRREVESGS